MLLIVSCLMLPAGVRADSPTDEIENYTITVDMLSDGTMNMTYHIDWKVLSDSAGPLTWVKIGIANEHVDSIKALSENISKIGYSSDDGDYIRIDLGKNYSAGDALSLDFSIHQSHMYRLDKQSDLVTYSFTPGWFDDIAVKSLTVKWNSANVSSSDAGHTDGNYLVWNTALNAGSRTTVSVNYRMGVFQTSEDGQADQNNFDDVVPFIFGGFIIVIVIIVAVFRKANKNYRGGFGTRGLGAVYYGHSGCACASSCACACACAGGGRAGCTAKNTFGNIRVEKLREKLALR